MNVEIGTGAADSGATLPVMGKDTWRRWLELDWIQQNRDKISYRTCAERLNGTKLDAERAMEAQALRSAESRHTLRAEADRAIQELQQQQAEMNAAANISISQESYSNHAQSCQLQEALRTVISQLGSAGRWDVVCIQEGHWRDTLGDGRPARPSTRGLPARRRWRFTRQDLLLLPSGGC